MGAIRFSIDSGLVSQLRGVLRLKVFVETGTYEGASVRAMLPEFDEIHTIELSAPLYASAVEAFADDANVHVHHGHSRDVLRELAPKLRRKSVLYWLDAHWCGDSSEGPAPEGIVEQCPLLEELEAIGSVNEQSVVLVDDARLFLAPPPAPATADGWPRLDEVLDRLTALNSKHELMVIDDVFVLFPPAAQEAVREYARHHAVDWLARLQETQRIGERVGEQLDRLSANNQRRNVELTDRVTSVAAAVGALEAEVKGLAERPAAGGELPKDLSKLRQDLKSVGRQVNPLTGQLDELGTQVITLSRSLDRLKKQLKASRDAEAPRIESQLEALDVLARSVESMRGRLESLGAAVEGGGEVPEAREEIRAVGERFGPLEAQLESLGSRLEALQAELGEAGARSQESSRALEGRLDPLTARIDSVGAELRALQETVHTVEARSEESRAVLGELPGARGDIRSVATAVQRLQAELGPMPEATLEQLNAIRGDLRSVEARLDAMAAPRGPRAWIAGIFGRSARPPVTQPIAEPEGTASEQPEPPTEERVAGAGVMFDPRLDIFERHAPRPLRVPRRYQRVAAPAHPPRISIVVPPHPDPGFLDRTIRSVLEQGYTPLELIVEASAEHRLATEVAERHRDGLARVEVRSNGNDPKALNAGLSEASGELLSALSPSTLLLPGSLAYVARYFERHPRTDVLYGHRLLLDEDDFEVGRAVLPRHDDRILSRVNCVPPEGLFWRRGIWELIGGGTEHDLRGGLDWALMLRLREAGARIVRAPRFLAGTRVGAGEAIAAASNGTAGGDAANGAAPADKQVAAAVRRYARRHTALQSLYQLHLLRY